MEGIGHRLWRAACLRDSALEPPLAGRHGSQGIIVERPCSFAHLGAKPPPIMGEPERADLSAIGSEWMQVAAARAVPVFEFDSNLEGRAGLQNKLILVEAEEPVH